MIQSTFAFLVALLPLTALATPKPATTSGSVVSSLCAKDAIYLQLAAPALASTASRFCSTYIRSTVSATATVTKSATATATTTVTVSTIIKKRAATINLSTLAPSALLSSACSCLLTTALPPATTVYPVTQTVTSVTTVTKTQSVTETCASAAFTSPISNGDFSQGSTGWTIDTNDSPDCSGPASYCFNNEIPGLEGLECYDGSSTGTDTPYHFTISQSLTACAGTRYTLTATFKSEFCNSIYTFSVDGQTLIDGSHQACGEGLYPYLDFGPYHTVTASFIAQTNAPVFAIFMQRGTALAVDTWSVQSIGIMPA